MEIVLVLLFSGMEILNSTVIPVEWRKGIELLFQWNGDRVSTVIQWNGDIV
jgi:hypothetical protein